MTNLMTAVILRPKRWKKRKQKRKANMPKVVTVVFAVLTHGWSFKTVR